MRIQRTSRVIMVSVVTLTAVCIACAFYSMWLRNREGRIYRMRLEALMQADRLQAGSDRLTQAVRAYAATGQSRYRDDYQREVQVDRNRDDAMARLLALGLASEESELITRAKRNSDALVPLEERAMALAARGQLTEATALVYGDEYYRAKESILGPLEEVRHRLDTRLGADADALARQATRSGFTGLTALVVNAVLVLGVLVFFYQRRVLHPLLSLNRTLHDLMVRKPGARIGYQEDPSEVGELARSLENYHRAVLTAEQERWVKSSEAEIDRVLHGAEQTEDFGNRLMSKLVPLVGGGWGVLHVLESGSGVYRFSGGYGVAAGGRDREFKSGVTLAGQAAADRRLLVIENLPADYLQVVSGVGSAPPKILVLVPVVMEDGVTAVMELATFQPLTDPQRALLEEVAQMVGLKLAVLLRNRNTRDLLEQIQRSNQLADLALEMTHCGYWKVDYRDPDYYWQSERAARILGEAIKPDGRYHLHHEWFSRLVEADPEAARRTGEVYQAAIEGKTPNYDCVYPYRRPVDGRIVWVHAMGSLERAPDGTAVAMYGVYQDITEAHEAEQQLRDSERRFRETEQFFRSVLEQAPDGLMVVNDQGVIELANARCEELFGYSRAELIGLSVDALVPQDVRHHHPALRRAYHESPVVREMGVGRSLRARRKDGSIFSVEIGLSPLPRREGRGAEVAVSVRGVQRGGAESGT